MSTETSMTLENVVNPKSLERQIKIIEQRLMELQSETSALEKRREACHILLGIPLAPVGASVEAAVAAPTKKTSRSKKKEQIEESAEQDISDGEVPEERSVIRASELI